MTQQIGSSHHKPNGNVRYTRRPSASWPPQAAVLPPLSTSPEINAAQLPRVAFHASLPTPASPFCQVLPRCWTAPSVRPQRLNLGFVSDFSLSVPAFCLISPEPAIRFGNGWLPASAISFSPSPSIVVDVAALPAASPVACAGPIRLGE